MTEAINDELYAQVLLCPMGTNGADAETVGEYLHILLETLWIKTDTFSGKRPFGFSSWPYELYEALIQGGFVQGVFDEDGYLDEFSEDEMEKADDLILQAIDYAFRPWRLDDIEEEETEEGEEEAEDEEVDDEELEHASNNGFAQRQTIVMSEQTVMPEETEDPILGYVVESEDDLPEDYAEVVAFVQAPEDDDFYVEDEPVEDVIEAFNNGQRSLTAPPNGIRVDVPDTVPEAWATDDQGSQSLPTQEDQLPTDSPEPQHQTQQVQSRPQPGPGATE